MKTNRPLIATRHDIEEPIRAELFSLERLEQHAESLAAAQVVTKKTVRGHPLIPRVRDNGRVLLESYRATSLAIEEGRAITPAAEWLVDNFHIVDEQLREIQDDLPTGYYRTLPKLASGHLEGYPRVYGVAWAFVAHTDSRFDPEALHRFVSAYQRVQPLTIGELWAVAITLRVVLIENLRRLAERIVRSRAARQEADRLAEALLGTSARPAAFAATLAEFENRPLETAFAVQLVQRLRDLDPKVAPVLVWLDKRLADAGTNADEVVHAEHQEQGAINISVRNIVTSMRSISAFDWPEFFEAVSLVDEILRRDTHFADMDFSTRDNYRHAIEDLSRGSQHSETEVAKRVVRHVQQAVSRVSEATHNGGDANRDRRSEPGYYLISRGRPAFERELGFHVSLRRWLLRLYIRAAVPGYLGTIALLTGVLLALPLLLSFAHGTGIKSLILLGVFAAVPASDLAIALINRAVMDSLGPRRLPRMELRGVPPELRTIIAVPTLLTTPADVSEHIERLEVHYLANPEGDLRFALISDWADAASETLPGDDDLLAIAVAGISKLNQRHGPTADGGDRFFIFHRRREWNERERKWMGWERKRGKLHELNQFLRGSTKTTFIPACSQAAANLSGVRYVITLDADTRLPRGTVARLVGTMAHPLNRPRFSASDGRVIDGYAIVQPRITPSLPVGREASIAQRIYSGPSGIDPYSAAVSDVYQDLFREGSYTGKGIYDIDAFEAALAGKVPENSLLSHDLFEGIFARVGLATDIELFEEFPSRYATIAARQDRWTRGDWQLLPWLLGLHRAPNGTGGRVKIPAIGRWKIFDNLRRTLSAPAMFLTLLAGWLLRPASPLLWTLSIIVALTIPAVLPCLFSFIPRRKGISLRSHFRGLFSDFVLAASHIALTLTFLAYQTWLMSVAIVRTLVRLTITRRNLLEWVTAAQAKAQVDYRLSTAFKRMAGALVIVAGTIAGLAFGQHRIWIFAAPFLAIWAASPALAWWISLPTEREAQTLTLQGREGLRLISRRTWRFFETFVNSENHSLPPDNFQEIPKAVLAHRTSPTNIGLYLLSIVSAHDLGWLGIVEMVERLESTLATMREMELFRGHFYNWYDTLDLHPLTPKYVSTVDSGNLAGHLLALANGCRERMEKSAFESNVLGGMRDTARLLSDALIGIPRTRRTEVVTRKQLSTAVDAIRSSLELAPAAALDWAERLIEWKALTQNAADIAQTLTQERGDTADSELPVWANALRACIESHARDAAILIPLARVGPKDVASLAACFREYSHESKAIELLYSIPTVAGAPDRFDAALRELSELRTRFADNGNATSGSPNRDALICIDALIGFLQQSFTGAVALTRRLLTIIQTAEKMVEVMEFGFLFDDKRKLFSIGYRVTDGAPDSNYYDLLASEARLASFVAIAKGEAPASHWFRLGRALTPVKGGSALTSWSGSMFEYLMPALVLRSPEGSLLSQTHELVVRRQAEYGGERGVPWGVSESAYNARDVDLTYQYASFGVPGLGLKRGLSDDLVIAPYATALAAMINPIAALENFARLEESGAAGTYGFYEALDYTTTRLPEGKDVALVRTYFAHHQGMTLVALANVLNDGAMRNRFHAAPMVQATELLLQERTPRDVMVTRPRAQDVSATAQIRELIPPVVRRFSTAQTPTPRTHLLSNGRYAVMLTAAGSGYSRWRDIAITRWREDVTCDCWGNYVFLRDSQTGQVWSAGFQPSGVEPDSYEASFFEDRAEFIRRDGALTTALEVVVSPEDDAEVRRVSITNLGTRVREIEVTSYAEICLAPQGADMAHPAFSNLFVQTEYLPEVSGLVATRRPQSDKETVVWVAHVAVVEGEAIGEPQFETDRARFIGRGQDIRKPISVIDGRPLSNTVGSVLDPIMSLRRTVRIPPGSAVSIVFSTIVAPSRELALDLADKYRAAKTFERTLSLAWTQAQVQLHHLGIDIEEAHLFQRLANSVLYSDPALRPSSDVLSQSGLERSALWAHSISGDLPIVLVRIDDPEDVGIVRQLLRAHEYWRMKQLFADIVIINEKPPSYAQDLQAALDELVRGSRLRLWPDTDKARGSIFLLRADLITPRERTLLQTIARAVLLSRRGTLSEQVLRSQRAELLTVALARPRRPAKRQDLELPLPALEFFNGLGGFAEQGREYITVLSEGLRTPAPWINVIANPSFGFLASESGSGHTWSLNSHENQLTPWSNDPVTDPPGEAIYVRDESTGEVWTPTALPIRDETAMYIACHGQGYSRFQHGSHGILLELLQFVPQEDSIKISRLTLRNDSGRARRLSVTAYAEWVLGSSRSTSAPYISTQIDSQTGAIFAQSVWGGEFGGRTAFADLRGAQNSCTGDRAEFIGRNGTLERPLALERGGALSGKAGAGLDPCAALQTSFQLQPGASAEIVFFLGEAENAERAREILARYRAADLDAALTEVKNRWDDVLGAVQVATPEPAMNTLMNRWLLYQTLGCRVWARAAFYQLSGAYGFRDQLQDIMALTVARRDVAREQLLRAAGRQFIEGDVQHWWHPPSGRGVRTRISDDLLWLPYAVVQFIEASGDVKVLDEMAPFLEGETLAEGQTEAYFQPRVSQTRATLFEHCARALDRSLSVGSHGLPLMGTGDWNDGMNRVGELGKGESIWLGWFLHTILWEFAKIADSRGEYKRAEAWRVHVSVLKAALERDGWDGEWYRRAYFDNGAPLGSAGSVECRIDSIAQSWGVISGAAEPSRAARAMAAVNQQLVRGRDGLVLLLTPPFDNTGPDPGYIRGYPPGIRENGGQYTHAATWAVIAFAALGDGDRAAELFRMLNPINRSNSRATVQRYKVEPYVAVGDVYSEPPHVGRGGWTWYTGSAGWLHRAGLEWILGFRLRGAALSIDPCIPREWPSYSILFRYHSATYRITVENPSGVSRGVVVVELDGKALRPASNIPLADDGAEHRLRVVLGNRDAAEPRSR
ncbi:MAG TPA: glucoamylase family protein [Candidatus Acidoferrales bacterium]|nr:glucoamylase family protein [Candidatus Acidoferrales bacterium]